jgi:hypothetical protein
VRDATQRILNDVSIGDLASRERQAGDDGGRYVI